jgi:hypothetical protein
MKMQNDYMLGIDVSMVERDREIWREKVYDILAQVCKYKLGYFINDHIDIEFYPNFITRNVKAPNNLGRWLYTREEIKREKNARETWSKYAA